MVTDQREIASEKPRYEIEPELQTELLAYPGKWTAITRSRLLAVGDSPDEVLGRARESGEKDPILYHVPDSDGVYYY